MIDKIIFGFMGTLIGFIAGGFLMWGLWCQARKESKK